MAMRMKETTYGAPPIQVLATPDHYVALGFKHAMATAGTPGLAVLQEGRYIVKAGTLYPSNDSNAIGVIFNDYDVTESDAMMAVVIHGFIKTAALPVLPTANALAAMKQLSFVPLPGTLSVKADTFVKAALAVGATTPVTKRITMTLQNGVMFRDAATTKTNWTITGEAATKATVSSIELSEDKRTITFVITTTSTALVAGDITALAGAACIAAGVAMTSAATIATVS